MNKATHTIQTQIDSPLENVIIQATDKGVSYVGFYPPAHYREIKIEQITNPHIIECAKQLGQYFNKQRQSFSLTLDTQGTEFQQAVWQALMAVPFGQTQSYSDIAIALNNPKAVRAVGAANGKNPISIIVPCHRIIGASGKLTGYAGGLKRKEWLLKHEGIL
ncbi:MULTISPECIES: methylated-DNA--[protein]-cysteine S-methyltransferase [unclassified Pseudoalteromonas]|uniref:methylated-DNA--[protein]-cysteine S-methyltransferase n=1 Tax=unclassified Pseudoalteromonas TaxID=194690 RepID=UPI000B3D28D2|nr:MULTISPECIES: methylated-DNA--[protein]-cysteine S-methyltransferase [unclassified Pseudoalteromonas]MDN3379831.1 methylated-DNA--[protein]-cysteine S-methyltransferase [Pseudoalteromonas sp. APC 3893]MDN3388171.1 methylated-DNA--[protein]-cysteine S-methyltransferase [Pseudoalteromonas sp. APC 4017]OUS73581.1 cysteine methyltransferase [Pseudoalteromonas sp. A601]